jgi:lipopolysaccharide transport system ATP-binding protein
MGNIVIRVTHLSKQYRIGAQQVKYRTFHEELAKTFRKPIHWLKGERKQNKSTIWALDDISFDVKQGEAVGIIGRNGAGKSTLLKILSRITSPTRGRVELSGRVGSLLEVGTGFHPELTGRENIFLNGAILGMHRQEILRKFDEIVAFAEIEKFLDTPVKHYSSGMYVRLAFAVAAHLEPEILIVDEVLAVGDIEFQKKCLGKMEDVSKAGRTVLFVSHNMGAIKALCSKAILLKNGALSFVGDTLNAVSHYTMHAGKDVAVVRWNEGDPPALPSAHLLEAGILSAGQQVGTDISTEAPMQIYIKFKVTKEERIGTTIILNNSDGAKVFVSLSNQEPNWHKKIRPLGIYESVCEIPPNFLADGNYSVSIVFWEGFYKAAITESDVLQFSAHEKGYIRGDLPYELKAGVVRPLLKWTSNFINSSN